MLALPKWAWLDLLCDQSFVKEILQILPLVNTLTSLSLDFTFEVVLIGSLCFCHENDVSDY